MRWARIDAGVVREIVSFDPSGAYDAALEFVAVPAALDDWLAVRWHYYATVFTPADLDAFKTEILIRAAAWAKALRTTIAGTDDYIEIASWASKEQAAMRHAAGAATAEDTAALSAEAALRASTVDDLAALINLKATAFRGAAATVTGLVKQLELALTTATDTGSAIAAWDAMMAAPELAALTGGGS